MMFSEELLFVRFQSPQEIRLGKHKLSQGISNSLPFIALMIASAVFRAGVLPYLWTPLVEGEVSVPHFAAQLLLLASVPMLILQRPWSGKRPPMRFITSVISNAVMIAITTIAILATLTSVGLVKLLMLERIDALICGVSLAASSKSLTTARRFQVGALAIAALAFTLWPSISDVEAEDEEAGAKPRPGLKQAIVAFDMQDERVKSLHGLAWFLVAAAVSKFRRMQVRDVAIQWGGAKRLHSISCLFASLFSWVISLLYTHMHSEESAQGAPWLISLIGAIFVMVLPYYSQAAAVPRLSPTAVGMTSMATSAVCVLIGGAMTNGSYTLMSTATTLGLLSAATLLSPSPGQETGVNNGGPSLPRFQGSWLPEAKPGTDSQFKGGFFKEFCRHATRDKSARRVLMFLSLNFLFMFVEIVYGYLSNSLSLMADAGHMLFDCSALVVGLYGSFMSTWKANNTYSFGYGRYEVLCGFTNGCLLVFVAIMIFHEGLERIFSPPDVDSEQLLWVAVAGFIVNLVGIVAFHDVAHNHGGDDHHNHGHGDHSHNHDDEEGGGHSHGHSHDHHGHHHHGGGCNHDNTNMQGVLLHVMADALGSVGVIISSLLIKWKGWVMSDPICSIVISALIFVSVLPLIKSTAVTLLQCTPARMEGPIYATIRKLDVTEGIAAVEDVHVWKHAGGDIYGIARVHCVPSADSEAVRKSVRIAFERVGVSFPVIEVIQSDRAVAQRLVVS